MAFYTRGSTVEVLDESGRAVALTKQMLAADVLEQAGGIDAFKGEKGDSGAVGPQGPVGPRGDPGNGPRRVARGRRFTGTQALRVTNPVDLSAAWSIALLLRVDAAGPNNRWLLHTADERFGLYVGSNQIVLHQNGTDSYGGTSLSAELIRMGVLVVTKAAGTARPRFHRANFHVDGSAAVASLANTTDWIVAGESGTGRDDVAAFAVLTRALTDAECASITSWQRLLALAPTIAPRLTGTEPRTAAVDAAGASTLVSAGGSMLDEDPLPKWWEDWPTVEFRAHEATDLREWAAFQKPTGQTTPTADTTVTDDGTLATRFQLRSGEREPGGTARNEVLAARRWTSGDERYFAWSTRIAAGVVTDAGKWSTLTQWRDALIADNSAVGSPSIENGLVHDGGVGILRLISVGSGGATLPIYETPATRDVWHRYVMRVLFSNDFATGFIEVWHAIDDGPLLKQTLLGGGTRMSARTIQANAYTQLKQGIYRDPTYARDWTVWHQGVIVTTDPADIPGLG